MPIYQIERRIGEISPEELDAAAFRALTCAMNFTGLRWLRSYFDAPTGNLTCYYAALSADDVRKHAEASRIPCDSVAEVVEYLPDSYR
jgi:hypothetical protein